MMGSRPKWKHPQNLPKQKRNNPNIPKKTLGSSAGGFLYQT